MLKDGPRAFTVQGEDDITKIITDEREQIQKKW